MNSTVSWGRLVVHILPWQQGHCRTSPSPVNLGWSNTFAQSETFGANSNGVSVKELVGHRRVNLRSRFVLCVGKPNRLNDVPNK